MRRAVVPPIWSVLLVLLFGCAPIGPFSCLPVVPMCSTPVAFTRSFHFESDCRTPLCGFNVDRGAARIVGAWHEGEHALQIDAGSTLSIPLNGRQVRRGGERIVTLVTCDPGATLTAIEAITIDRNGVRQDATILSTLVASTRWTMQTGTFFELGTLMMLTSDLATANTLSLEVSGTGSCTVDDVDYEIHEQRCPQALLDAGFDADPGRDASVDARDARTDVPIDTGRLFQRCITSADCGTGFTCNLLFPGGLCTRRCTNDRACGTGVCDTELGCLPSCTPHGGLECDEYGAACFPYDAAGAQFVCFPSCFPTGTMPPAGYANTCVPPNGFCDPDLLMCTPPYGHARGAIAGDPCMADTDCQSGRCIPEIDDSGTATGYVGGQCSTVGRLPSGDAYQMDMPLPRSNCPEYSVAIPFSGEDAEGDPANCIRSCILDTDCRAGYSCNHFGDPSMPAFTNGICVPVDCNQSGMLCPSGYHCVTNASDAAIPPGHCEAGGDADAGVDDAASTDVVDATTDTDAVTE